MTFSESNTVEAFIRDQLCGGPTTHTAIAGGLASRQDRVYGLGWHFLPPQGWQQILLEAHLCGAFIHLDPDIASQLYGAGHVGQDIRSAAVSCLGYSWRFSTKAVEVSLHG
jgi:type I restriction enzyme, R subunit